MAITKMAIKMHPLLLFKFETRLKTLPSRQFFTVHTKLAEMALLASKDFTTVKNKVVSSGAWPITGLGVQCLTK